MFFSQLIFNKLQEYKIPKNSFLLFDVAILATFFTDFIWCFLLRITEFKAIESLEGKNIGDNKSAPYFDFTLRFSAGTI